MSSELSTGMRLAVHPCDGQAPAEPAMVLVAQRETTIRFRNPLPDWCVEGVEVELRHTDGAARPVRWTTTVLKVTDDEHLATLAPIDHGEALERRRAARPPAPVPVEWSQPPDRTQHPGIGIDLNRLGIRFRVGPDAQVRNDRIVLAVHLPTGSLSAQGRVVRATEREVRVEFVAVHPEALRRLVAWEADGLIAELAPPTRSGR